MEPITRAPDQLEREMEAQMRAQERQLVAVRLVMVALAAVFVAALRDQLPAPLVVIGLLGVVAAYSLAIPWLLGHFPAREVGIVTTALDMVAVTVAVYVVSEAVDTYLFYGLVILGAALRFGLGASIWSALVVSFMYVAVVLAGPGSDPTVRELLPIRVAYLVGFGVVAGLFSRVVIGRATENARLQQRVAEDERERSRTRERELLSRLGRDFGASLERDATVAAVANGAAPLLGDATLVYLVDAQSRRLVPAASAGPDGELARAWMAFARARGARLGEGIAGSAAATASTAAGGIASSAPGDADGLEHLDCAWTLAVPIVAGGRVLGVLATIGRSASGGPDDAQRRLAEAIAERAGPALQNARLWADLQERMALERQAQRIKDDFLSIVSHELRTPLTSIQGYSQLLESRLRTESGTNTKELSHLRVIRTQVGRMRRLVDDLLDVSRIDRRGGVSIEPVDFDLAEALRDAVARLRRENRERRVELDAPEAIPVHADRDRIDQVLVNLLENAVKYSPDGGQVTVNAEAVARSVEVRVADEGVGIPREHLDHVFERFYQANDHAGRRRFGGLGLGLYISRAIVDAHGGRIWASPNERAGRGTVFAFRIPRIAAVRPPPELPMSGEPPPFVVRRGDGEAPR
ncbi:MAG: GAF domain-containing sensor histidine kinase [Candidatus Limnocylindria bacterium]